MINQSQAKKSFNRSVKSYDQNAKFQNAVASTLLQRLQWVKIKPKNIVDLGTGTGFAIKGLFDYYPEATIIATDISENMLAACRERYVNYNNLQTLCSDMQALPIEDNSIDLIYSSLALHWQSDLLATLIEMHRILAPGGVFIFSTLGVDTLKELRYSWQQVDSYTHVHNYFDMHDVGDALMQAHFSDPVMDMEYEILMYDSVKQLARQLQGLGVHNVDDQRMKGLTSRSKWQAFEQAYEKFRRPQGLPATYEVIYGIAWKSIYSQNKNSGEIRLDQIKRRI